MSRTAPTRSIALLVALVAACVHAVGCAHAATPDPSGQGAGEAPRLRTDGRVAPDRAAGAPRGSPAEEAAVLAELHAYYADFSARDWEAFASHFWTGATITTAWQPPGEEEVRVVITSVPEFVAQAPEGPGSREVFEEHMAAAEVRITGNLAQVWARYSARFGDPGDIMEWEGTDAFTLMELDGRWRITSLAFASDDSEAGPEAHPDPHPDTPNREREMTIERLTPLMYVEAIEPLLPFWVDRLGFRVTTEVPEGEHVGFVILEKDATELMIQTRASVEADVPSLADTPMGGTVLFLRVDDLEPFIAALEGVKVVVPRRRTFYGADEFVREPAGNIIGFAAFSEETPSGG